MAEQKKNDTSSIFVKEEPVTLFLGGKPVWETTIDPKVKEDEPFITPPSVVKKRSVRKSATQSVCTLSPMDPTPESEISGYCSRGGYSTSQSNDNRGARVYVEEKGGCSASGNMQKTWKNNPSDNEDGGCWEWNTERGGGKWTYYGHIGCSCAGGGCGIRQCEKYEWQPENLMPCCMGEKNSAIDCDPRWCPRSEACNDAVTRRALELIRRIDPKYMRIVSAFTRDSEKREKFESFMRETDKLPAKNQEEREQCQRDNTHWLAIAACVGKYPVDADIKAYPAGGFVKWRDGEKYSLEGIHTAWMRNNQWLASEERKYAVKYPTLVRGIYGELALRNIHDPLVKKWYGSDASNRGIADGPATEYCAIHPTDKFCRCLHPMIESADGSGNLIDMKQAFGIGLQPECHLADCTGEGYKTSSMCTNPCKSCLNLIQQFAEKGATVVGRDFKQEMTCSGEQIEMKPYGGEGDNDKNNNNTENGGGGDASEKEDKVAKGNNDDDPPIVKTETVIMAWIKKNKFMVIGIVAAVVIVVALAIYFATRDQSQKYDNYAQMDYGYTPAGQSYY